MTTGAVTAVGPTPRRRRAAWLVSASLAAVVIAGIALHSVLTTYRPIGSGPAGPTVPAAPFSRPWSQRPVLVLGLGDSVTAGLGADPGYAYFARLVDNPPDEYPDMRGKCLRRVFPRLRRLNLAVSGTTSLQHEADQIPRIPRQEPEVPGWVVMTSGGNDLIHHYGRGPIEEGGMYGADWPQAQPWIARYEERLGAMLDAVEGRFPGGCHIFLASIYDPTDGVGDLQHAGAMLPQWPDCLRILEAYNTAIRRCAAARDNVHLVDMRGLFMGHGIHCSELWRPTYRREDPTYWYFDNLEDPNHRGYDALRRAFLLEMITVARALDW